MARLDWDSLSALMASKLRLAVLRTLRSPRTPTQLARSLDIPLPHVSRALRDLREMGAVRCVNPQRRKGRLYTRKAKGKRLLDQLRRLSRRL